MRGFTAEGAENAEEGGEGNAELRREKTLKHGGPRRDTEEAKRREKQRGEK